MSKKEKPETTPEITQEAEVLDVAKIQADAIKTILDNGVEFDVTVNNPCILHKIGLLPKEKTFVIRPIRLGTLLNISRILSEMESTEISDSIDLFQAGIAEIVKHKDKILTVVSLAILNCRETWFTKIRLFFLRRYLNDNLTAKELLQLLILVTNQMDVRDFLASTVLIKKLNLIETGKTEEKMNADIQITGKSLGE
jgi:hypothetical protein